MTTPRFKTGDVVYHKSNNTVFFVVNRQRTTGESPGYVSYLCGNVCRAVWCGERDAVQYTQLIFHDYELELASNKDPDPSEDD